MDAPSLPAARCRTLAPSRLPTRRSGPVLGRLVDVLLWLSLAFVVFVAGGTFGNRWYRIVALQGGSMSPTLQRGDALIVTPPPAVLEPGTIVVLQAGSELVTHRLIAVTPNGQLVTKGDANRSADHWASPPAVAGICRCRIPYLGGLITCGHQALSRVALAGQGLLADIFGAPTTAATWQAGPAQGISGNR